MFKTMKTLKTLLIAALVASPSLAFATTIEMKVDGLVCAFCAQGIEKKLRGEAATSEVFVSLEKSLVAVALKPKQDIADKTLKDLLADAGYTVRDIKRTQESLEAVKAKAEKP